MEKKPLESDWKVYSRRVSGWRERYLTKKNKEIIAILADEGRTPTGQFWDAKHKMEEEARILVECLDNHSRSKMEWTLILMYHHGLIGDEDLEEFSKELREHILASRDGFG